MDEHHRLTYDAAVRRVVGLMGAVLLVLAFAVVTGYPGEIHLPSWLVPLELGLALLALAISYVAKRLIDTNSAQVALLLAFPVFLAPVCVYTERLESIFIWGLLPPAIWVARQSWRPAALVYLIECVVVVKTLSLTGEPDEMWRGLILLGVVAALSWTEYGAARDERRFLAAQAEAREQLTRTLRAVDTAATLERQDVAGQLHDFPVQRLMATLMQLRRVHGADEKSTAGIQRTIVLVQESIDALRKIMDGLMPTSLSQVALADALGELGRVMQSSYGVEVKVHDSTPSGVKPELRLPVYRMLSEAVVNSAKHSEAQSITVDVSADGLDLIAMVTDEGRGLEQQVELMNEVPPGAGTGLTLLVHQAQALGGDIWVSSIPGLGMRLRFRVPLAFVSGIERVEREGDDEQVASADS